VIIPHVVQTSKNIYDYELIRSGHDPSSFDLEKPNNKLAEMCNKLGIDYLDLLPVMKEESSQGKLLYFPRDAHWNAEGHRIAAREIYKDLTGRGWLQ
jgi:lysophospholipase L1-like esterase